MLRTQKWIPDMNGESQISHNDFAIFYLSFHFISRWFCHFDDDNYVNLPALIRTLKEYDPKEDWYLGKTSIQNPLEVINRGAISPVSQNYFTVVLNCETSHPLIFFILINRKIDYCFNNKTYNETLLGSYKLLSQSESIHKWKLLSVKW